VTIQTQGPTKLLVDTIIETVVKVVLSGRSRITVCAANGVSCEGWLKVELLRGLVDALGSTDATEILPEAQNVDLTVRRASDQVLLELKTFPTNYGGVANRSQILLMVSLTTLLSCRIGEEAPASGWRSGWPMWFLSLCRLPGLIISPELKLMQQRCYVQRESLCGKRPLVISISWKVSSNGLC